MISRGGQCPVLPGVVSEGAPARELLETLVIDAMPLLEKHWAELASYKDIPLELDLAQYAKAEEMGILRIYAIRRKSVLIGYAVSILSRHAHYRSSLQAKEDVIYVDPAHRGGLLGFRLVRFCDEQLRLEGVQVVHHHVKLTHPTLGHLLERMGYEAVETLYSKRLDK